MSRKELGMHFGVHASTIGKWEREVDFDRFTRRIPEIEDWLNEGTEGLIQPQVPDSALPTDTQIEEVAFAELPRRIRDKRMKWGMTRGELAEYLGVYYLSIKSWEDNKWKPSSSNYGLICQWLAQDITSWLYGTGGN